MSPYILLLLAFCQLYDQLLRSAYYMSMYRDLGMVQA